MQAIDRLHALENKSLLIRIDTDVDIEHGRVVDDSRLRAALPTIRYVMQHGAKVTLMGHMGRPKGQVVEELSLEPVARHLAHLLVPHSHIKTLTTEQTSPVFATQYQLAKDVVLLENLRFDPREEANEESFAKELVAGKDVYVNESFATCHRAAASVVGVAKLLASYGGLRLVDELAHLNLIKHPNRRPVCLIVGGAKVEEKLGLLEYLLPQVDYVLTGGVVANILLKAQGVDVKKSKLETGFDDLAVKLLKSPEKVQVPTDYLWDREMIVDIGEATTARYVQLIKQSETIFWAGTMGIVEDPRFAHGSKAIAETLAKHHSIRMVGGGDTAAALQRFHLIDKMSFVSTGGGAALEYLADKTLPGVAALESVSS